MVKTRIRQYRKQKGLTQLELADRVGTTAATISRLETSDMTVSMDWLSRFSAIFHVPVSELIDEPATGRLELLGLLRRGGRLMDLPPELRGGLNPDLQARDPVALQVGDNLGGYRSGDILIGDRLSRENMYLAFHRDCIVLPAGSKQCHCGRLIPGDEGNYWLTPAESGAQTMVIAELEWAAPIVTLIRHF